MLHGSTHARVACPAGVAFGRIPSAASSRPEKSGGLYPLFTMTGLDQLAVRRARLVSRLAVLAGGLVAFPAVGRQLAAVLLATLGGAAVVIVPGSAWAQAGGICAQIRAQIARLDSAPSGGGTNRRFAVAAQRQRAEIATAQGRYQAAGCGGFFQSGQCSALDGRIRQMRANLAQLEAQASGGGMETAGRAQQRARLLAAFDANGCRGGGSDTRQAQPGREYRTPDYGRPQAAYRAEPSAGFGGFIEHLFGASREPARGEPNYVEPVPEETLRPQDSDGEQRPRNVGHRAVCVRLCDGAFFPMTSSARPGASLGQEEMCQMQCPGAEVALYRMRDDQIENAVSMNGSPYTALPNALRFRQRFDAACTCRPRNGSWAEAFSHRQDPTLRTGDQVISAEQARLLSMPAGQRQAAREEFAAAERARREAERQGRADRSRASDGRPRGTIGLDGRIRPAQDQEPAEIRGAAPLAQPAPEPPADELPLDAERRPVRIIGPTLAPRADAPAAPAGG